MTKKEQLIQKLNTSYAEHRESWLHMKPEDLILLASNITAADYAVRCIGQGSVNISGPLTI